ncbi:hypothetical protein PIIN_11332 [Serendipita indica DSM 11827]|uniref:Uncharacterized protein n=1 Tax=Serendipita indica (strain DSM 11827) TaxID=1109443 RepID=G4U1B2_SERID|nr:hypothetical protein PIIN_11332 [Serendipita indica DSM 11827]
MTSDFVLMTYSSTDEGLADGRADSAAISYFYIVYYEGKEDFGLRSSRRTLYP